ncbi:MAG: HDOD domain-containing protein [Gammaproteobacteria bacterium]|nr:HDOD domain-containing protein [Gammaproteobacteria bacterium]
MTHPDIQCLQRIRSLSQFDAGQLEALAQRLEIVDATAGEMLMDHGYAERDSLYPIEGSLCALSRDGVETRFDAGADGELAAIARLRPSMYRVSAVGAARYLRIHDDLLTEFAQTLEGNDDSLELVELEQSEEENALTIELFQDLMAGKLTLPSLPHVAARIQQAFDDDAANAETVSQIIQTDPAITAKLIMIANSALYGGQASIESLQQAVVRLGAETTRKQVMIYAVKELFQARTDAVRKQMIELWKHCQQVASLSRLLAGKIGGFDREQAQLAGLVHDLGEVAILHYAQDNPVLSGDADLLRKACNNLRPQITGMLLNQWNFGTEFITVGEESEHWFRNPADEADLCDLVMIAQYHSYIGTEQQKNLPPAASLPAFDKLGMGDINVAQIVEFLQQSRAEIEAIESHLAAI